MRIRRSLALAACLFLFSLSALAEEGHDHPDEGWKGARVEGTLAWEGEVTVKTPLLVTRAGKLKVLPGAKVIFDLPHSGDHGPVVLVLGEVEVAGTRERPVEFNVRGEVEEDDPHDLFSVQGALSATFKNARFTGAGWAIHLHDTPGAVIEGCEFRGNYGGVRFRCDGLAIRGNTFADNRIGVRSINSTGAVFRGNSLTGNLAGIFFREGIEGAVVKDNYFENREYDIKLGEGQTLDVDATGNRWRAQSVGKLDEYIYDALDSPGIGRVITGAGTVKGEGR